jgi:hypothetical protein
MKAILIPLFALFSGFLAHGLGAETEHGYRLTRSIEKSVTVEFVLPKQMLIRHVASFQWNPETEECPLNILEGVKLARGHLEATRQNISHLKLHHVSIGDVDVGLAAKDGDAKQWHKVWFATFQFSGYSPNNSYVPWPELQVVMLLDKTILDAVVTSGQLTCPIVQK